MTDIENKARRRLNEAAHITPAPYTVMHTRANNYTIEAFCRLIEEFEAYKREVSDPVASALAMYQRVGEGDCLTAQALRRFILPKPVDPLEEVWNDMGLPNGQFRQNFSAALAARGLEITQKKEQN